MNSLSTFKSSLAPLGQTTFTEQNPVPSQVKAQDPGSHSDVVSATKARCQRILPQTKSRSKKGCWRCRQRKVKCDEARPKCGSCIRLDEECVRTQTWNFIDCRNYVQRRNKHISTAECPSWHEPLLRHRWTCRNHNWNTHILPPFTEVHDEDERERVAMTRPPGTFNIVLIPDSFARLPEYGGPIKPAHGWRRSLISATAGSNDPDLIILTEFIDSPYSAGLSKIESREVYNLNQFYYISSMQRDITDYGIENTESLLLHWQHSVAKRLMPLASAVTLFDVIGQECPMVRESRTFQPLYHAICAISMLSLAFGSQRQLLAGAFRHYHHAITTCMSSTIKPAGNLIYLHYILLVYDICCAAQGRVSDGQMWAQHFQRLSSLACHSVEVNEIQAHLLSYTLYLDAQSCLAGNPESGTFVRTYQMQDSRLPTCRETQNSLQQTTLESAETDVFAACIALSNFMRTRFADLSQLALQVRQDVDIDRRSVTEHRRHIADFRDELRTSWKLKCPAFLSYNSSEGGANMPTLVRGMFDFASLQYSTAMIYLHTSMYRGQQMHASYLQHKEISLHCRLVLARASAIIDSRGTEQNYVILPIFLAGVASSNDQDRIRAIGLMRALKSTGISYNVYRSRQLLEAVHSEQGRLVECGGSAAEVDWISYSSESRLRSVNMGL